MGRLVTPEADLRRRKKDWGRARKRCPLSAAEVAQLVGRSEDTVRKYNARGGLTPPWEVIRAVEEWNLRQAIDIFGEAFGEDAITLVTGAAA